MAVPVFLLILRKGRKDFRRNDVLNAYQASPLLVAVIDDTLPHVLGEMGAIVMRLYLSNSQPYATYLLFQNWATGMPASDLANIRNIFWIGKQGNHFDPPSFEHRNSCCLHLPVHVMSIEVESTHMLMDAFDGCKILQHAGSSIQNMGVRFDRSTFCTL